jgi:L-ascorbate metabolism protein UlaG (beta-lactamase superfamily)
MTAAPCSGGDLPDVDLVLVSHRHTDHLDPDTLLPLLQANPRAQVALPAALLEFAGSRGIPPDRLIGLAAGDVCDRAGFSVRAIPSAHESLETDPAGRHLCLGFLVESQGIRFYHPGDSIVYDGLVEALEATPCDAFFLPINGRDPRRGVPGNMNSAEAVDLAGRCRPRYLIPHHYDMFTFNTVPVAEFLTEARRLPACVSPVVLSCGQRWELAR